MTERTLHDVNRFVGTVAAACVAHEWELAKAAFSGMGPEIAAALAAQVSFFLAHNADPVTYAEAAWHLPTEYLQTLSSEAIKRFPAAKGPPPSSRSILSKMAFRLLREGASGRVLVDRIREANETLTSPMKAREVDDLLVWVAQRHMQEARNATGAANAG